MIARLALAVAAFALTAAGEPPDPPPHIAERIEDGRFEPGNFEYLRGYFPEASETEKARYEALVAWLDQCAAQGKARLDAELAELGVTLLEGEMIGAANICQQITRGEQFGDFESYDELAKASRGARLVFDALVSTVERAQQRGGPSGPDDLSGFLLQRTMGEQLLRLAFGWGRSEGDAPRTPSLTPEERTVFMALLGGETLRTDHANTQWLKTIVAEEGWPTISKVGERGSGAAWLLTQHADLDPAFQLRALRLMEPLVAEGEVSKRNYAYLYDRVMLKLTGKQRYATQMTCEDGDFVPRPLEDAERVEDYRSSMELEPFSEYRANFPDSC